MSGDVQPRKRKDKKKKKDEPSLPPFVYVKDEAPVIVSSGNGGGTPSPSSDELIHVYKESRLGGNICAKIIFFLLLGTLAVLVGLIITEHRGSNEVATATDSPWSQMFEGWIDDSPPEKHDDEHDAPAESGEHDEDEGHADHDDHDDHDGHEDDEDDHDDEEDNAVLEQVHEAKSASSLGSESKVSGEEEEEDGDDGADEPDENEEEEEPEEDQDDDDSNPEHTKDDEGQSDEDNDGADREPVEDPQDARPSWAREEDDNDATGEEEFPFREIPGVSSSAEENDETDDVDSAQGNIDQDEEDDINEPTGQGYDAGYYSANEDDDKDENDEDDNDNDDNEDDGYETDNNDAEDEDDNIDSNEIDADHEENAEKNDGVSLRGDQAEEDDENQDDEQDEEEGGEDQDEGEEEEQGEQEEHSDGDEQEQRNIRSTRHVDDYEEVGIEREVERDEQQLESDDDFEEILDPPETTDAEKEEEEIESLEPTGVALKFGVGLAIILVAHVVLVRKWNESDQTPAATLQPPVISTAAVPRRQTLIPPTVDPSNLIPDSDDVEEYSDEEFDEDVEDPLHTQIVRESLASKYGRISPEASEDEEVDDEEEEIEDEDVEDEEDAPEMEFDKQYGFKLASVSKKQTSQEEDEGEEAEDEELEDEEEGVEEEEEEDDYASHSNPWRNVRQPQQDSDPEVSDREEVSDDEQPPAKAQVWRTGGGPKDTEVELEWPLGPDFPPEPSTSAPSETATYDALEMQLEENPDEVMKQVRSLLAESPEELALLSLQAQALDKLAEKKRSNKLLEDAIAAYLSLLQKANISDDLYLKTADRCINRIRFRGQHAHAVAIHKLLIKRFPKISKHRNDLAVTYLMTGKTHLAKEVLEETLKLWPLNGFALVHYGFVLKTSENNNKDGSRFMQAGLDTKEPGTMDARFLFHLGDAYNRIGQHSKAEKVYELGVEKRLFRSKHQRSLYNVDRLTARPWWTLQQTTYVNELRKFEERWKEIRDEGMAILQSHGIPNSFKDEAENLRDKGVWKQLELYARGQQMQTNCKRAPITCQLISQFPAAHSCRRGQAKFSVMHPNTHVWPHCGPTNCRLRAHLGLVVPPGTELRVGDEKRSWQEGKVIVFDDSFEHEVWHNGTSIRLVLIVDLWHPELTTLEQRSLPAI